MNCREIVTWLETDPTDAGEPAVRSHLESCADCRAQAEALRRAFAHLASAAEGPADSERSWGKLRAALEKEPAPGEPCVCHAEPTERAAPVLQLNVKLACAFCHDVVERSDTVYCAACLAPHHAECFATHGTCSVHGCGETRTVRSELRAGPARAARRRLGLVAAVLLAGAGGVLVGSWGKTGSKELAERPRVPVGPSQAPESVVDPPQPLDSPLQVSAELERGVVSDPTQPVSLVVSLNAREQALAGDRPPARIALVVDCSSSMSDGDKMSGARRATEAFLSGLGPQDRFTVIGFGNDAQEVVPWQAGGAPPLHLLAKLQPQGGTNIGAAVEAGRLALAALPSEAGVLRRVVLFTDGAPTVGLTDPERLKEKARELQAQGVTLSCHGFGTDINAPLLVAMAELGGGTFLYVDKNELAVRAFEIELQRALGTVITATQVRIEPAAGVEIEGIVSWNHDAEGAARVIRVGDLTAGVERKVVARLRWKAGAAKPGEQLPMATVRWTAARVKDGLPIAGDTRLAATLGTPEQAVASYNVAIDTKLTQAELAWRVQLANYTAENGDAAAAREQLVQTRAWAFENRGRLNLEQFDELKTNGLGSEFFELTKDIKLEDAESQAPGVLLPVGK